MTRPAPITQGYRKAPLVSVIISNYNYGSYVGDAIRSALSQTFGNTEVIVVDDGSTDGSREVIGRFIGTIHPIYSENRGQCAALNTGLAASHGEIVIFADADDYLVDDAIERLVRPFLDNPAVTKSQGYMIAVDAIGKPLGRTIPRILSPSGCYRNRTLEQGPQSCGHAWTSANAWARWFLDEVFPLPEGPDKRGDPDGCLNPVSTLFGPISTVEEPVAYYRIHGRNSGPVGAVFTPESLIHQLRRTQDNYEFFLHWAKRFGASPNAKRFLKWKRSWRDNLMAYTLSLMDSSQRPPAFHEVVLAPLMNGSTGPLKSSALVVALAVVWLSPRRLALDVARRLLGIPAESGSSIPATEER
jgi:glycosyltransferase involved in cell wall biosynthesis